MSDWLYCRHCGEPFDDHDVVKTKEYLTDDPRDWVLNYECPFCHSDDLEEADSCERCGKVLPIEDLRDGICDDCIDDLITEFKEKNKNAQ